MTDATDRARKALKGITPGPWEANVDGAGDYFITRPDGQAIVDISGGDDASEPDAKFVAAARSLVPDLLAEIDALRAESRAARVQGMRDAADWLEGEETAFMSKHQLAQGLRAIADALEKEQADD